jgi:hypothetical protein
LMIMRRTTDGKASLAGQARPTKASSIEARQHRWADTTVEYTHALARPTETTEGIQKPSSGAVDGSSLSSLLLLQAAAPKRRVLEGASRMRTCIVKVTIKHTNVE